MNFTDTMISDWRLRKTDDGHVVQARVAKGGNVQDYAGSELGVVDRKVVRVYRPEDAVFSKAAINTYARKPITIGHPAGGVTDETWKELAVGEIDRDVMRDGEFVSVPLLFRDAKAIARVQAADGPKELSMGYEANITFEDGVSPAGEAYDAVMTGFRMNHVAVVPRARGGSELRIGDGANNWGIAPITVSDKKEKPMSDAQTTVVVGDKAVQVSAADAAILDAFKASMTKELSDAKAAHKTEINAKDEEIGTLKADLKKAQDSAPDQSAIDKMVADRAALVSTVAKVAKDVKPDGMSDADLRKAAVAAKLGDEEVKDVSDAEIKGMFAVVARDADKSDPVAAALKDGGGKQTVDDGWGSVLPMKKEA